MALLHVQMLARLPEGYKVRLYPDICHTLTAMYPVPDWSFIWANTHGRQVVNPLPRHYGYARLKTPASNYATRVSHLLTRVSYCFSVEIRSRSGLIVHTVVS